MDALLGDARVDAGGAREGVGNVPRLRGGVSGRVSEVRSIWWEGKGKKWTGGKADLK